MADIQDLIDQVTGRPQNPNEMPGALNQGWANYFMWGDKSHSAWAEAFKQAEANRREEDDRYLTMYDRIYHNDHGFLKKAIMFALNGIQLWALQRQFKQQKEIADRTWEVANRMQEIADETFAFYLQTYNPHEKALGNQINDYFNNTPCVEYDEEGGRFEDNVERAFNSVQQDLTKCNPLSEDYDRDWELTAAKHTSTSRNHAYRYSEHHKHETDDMWLDYRMKYIQVGRGISSQGKNGIRNAFDTFNSFGADPGAALSQLLNQAAYTLGNQTADTVQPKGQMLNIPHLPTLNYDSYLVGPRQSGDLPVGKTAYAGK